MKREMKRPIRTLRRSGNGITCVIPKPYLARLGWNEHDHVAIDIIDNKLVLTKVQLPSVPDLRGASVVQVGEG